MIYSPIKTIITNNTDKAFIAPISSRMRIHLNPKGTPGDAIQINGDAFTYTDRVAIAESLMMAVLDSRIKLEYSIDKMASYGAAAEINFNSSVLIMDQIKLFGAPVAEPESVAEPCNNCTNSEPVKQEPEKTAEKEVEKPAEEEVKQVEEQLKQEPVNEEAPEAKVPQDEPKQEDNKPAKKKRQIKID